MNPFDPNKPLHQTRRNLPHWRQAGCMYYVTFRLADSLPQTLLKQWQAERTRWMGLNPRPWSAAVIRDYARRFQGPVEKWLDAGHGSCALRDTARRGIVADALRFFDGERYALDAFVVMPNHVHALVVPKCDTGFPAREVGGEGEGVSGSGVDGDSDDLPAGHAESQAGKPASHSLTAILQSWKGYTAWKINQLLGKRGPFWMDESFDHLVRSEKQRVHFQNYIRENPEKAGLREDEYSLWGRESDTSFPAFDPPTAEGAPIHPGRESEEEGSGACRTGEHGAQAGKPVSHSHSR